MALDDIYVRTLTKNRVKIREMMSDVTGVLLDHLMINEIIKVEQRDSIMAENTATERKRIMMDILVKCSPKERVFNVFCDALDAVNYGNIRKILREDFEQLKRETNPTPLIVSGHETTSPAQEFSAGIVSFYGSAI